MWKKTHKMNSGTQEITELRGSEKNAENNTRTNIVTLFDKT